MFRQLPNNDVEMLHIFLNGQSVQVQKGITVAAMALTHGLRYARTTPISQSMRAPFCMMGVCYDCLMVINGKANQRACATYVKEGMRVDTQQGVGPELGGDFE